MPNGYESRIGLLAQQLEAAGVDAGLALTLSYGIADRLRRLCWAGQTDVIGDAAEVARQAKCPVPSLAYMLVRAGVLGSAKGIYYMPTAVTEAPEYVRKRWLRCSRQSYDEARSRAADPLWESAPNPLGASELAQYTTKPDSVDTPKEGSPEAAPLSLFGEAPTPTKKKEKTREPRTPGHKELCDYWCAQWEKQHGTKYPFAAKDGVGVSRLLKAATSIDHARTAIDAYLAARDRFYAGHPFGKFLHDLPRWLSVTGGSSRGEMQYSGAGAALPEA